MRSRGRCCLTDLDQDHLSLFVPASSINLRALFVWNLNVPQETLTRDGERSTLFTDHAESRRIFLVGFLGTLVQMQLKPFLDLILLQLLRLNILHCFFISLI